MNTFFSQRREVGEFKKRYKWMAGAVILAFAALLARVVYLQVVRHEHYAGIARDNITKVVPLPASRGLIRDSNGRLIANNRPSYVVYVTPQHFDTDEQLPLLAQLMQLPNEKVDTFRERLERVPRARWSHKIEFFRDIKRDQMAALETHSRELPGVDVIAEPRRVYPFGRLGAHAVGYLNEVNKDDLDRLVGKDYGAGDRIGRVGIEQTFEGELRGSEGFSKTILPLRLESIGQGPKEIDRVEPRSGNNLTLALDMELMKSVERAFRAYPSGAAVVVDPRNGYVRALYSKPSYDLNEISGGLSVAAYDELRTNPYRPLIDKAVYETYPPGSTFKPVTALAALDMEEFDAGQRVSCAGHYEVGRDRFRCTAAHGDVDVRMALVESCNIFFWKSTEQIGLERLNHYANDFGFGEHTGLGLSTEARGFMATKAWYQERGRRFMIGHLMNIAIGQGNTKVTVLQMAMAYAAIANGGTLYEPRLVERVTLPDGTVVSETRPRPRRQLDVSQESLALVVDGLHGVVHDPSGTAHDPKRHLRVEVAGKTGTAQVQRGRAPEGEDPEISRYLRRSHAWFAGFAPARNPTAVVVVLIDHGGAGGRYAAPIALNIIDEYLGDEAEAAAEAAGGP